MVLMTLFIVFSFEGATYAEEYAYFPRTNYDEQSCHLVGKAVVAEMESKGTKGAKYRCRMEFI